MAMHVRNTKTSSDKKTRRWSLLSACLLPAIILLYFIFPQHAVIQSKVSSGRNPFRAPRKNIWSELSEDEAKAVFDLVLNNFTHLHLTKRPHSSHDNFINTVELLRSNKSTAAPYAFEDGPIPERWAKVTIGESHSQGPRLVYYMVGPLPVNQETEIRPLSYVFNSGRNWVQNPLYDYVAVQNFGVSLAKNVSDITQELLGASSDEGESNEQTALFAFPRSSRMDSGGLVLWLQFYRPGLGSGARTLLPQGIYAKVDASSPNITDWRVGQYYYNGIIYADDQEFRAAIKDSKFETTPPNIDGSWTDTEDFDSQPAGRELPPPVTIQPYGPRYKLDREQRYVSWFGFQLYITTARASGVSLFDIRFKGERVMYELGLQEAMAHYAGDDPMQGGLEFMDSFFGMGKNAFELVPGYDCPAYADYLDSEWHAVHSTTKMPNSICIFEFTADHLLSRHTAQYSVTVSRNTYLVIRSVSTVGNYDYQIDYIFYLDGSIEVKVRASGFIFAAFYTANKHKREDEYGHRIHDALSSSMHDHVINFKADLDVAGSSNDMVRLAFEPVTTSYSWDQPEVTKRNTMHLVEYPVEEEVGLDWPKNSAEFYTVYSSDKKNAWGERRGYRITSGTGMGSTPHLTILNSTTLGESARWAEHDVWVLRQKDTEPASADPLNYLEPQSPLVDFSKQANHESLVHDGSIDDYDGDLVVYFNLGAHHLPHSGDVPNTLMHTSASSVMFVPHNFADRDPSRESVQGVRLQLKGKNSGGFAGEEPSNADLRNRGLRPTDSSKKPAPHYFGATYENELKVPLEALEPDLTAYRSTMHGVSDVQWDVLTLHEAA